MSLKFSRFNVKKHLIILFNNFVGFLLQALHDVLKKRSPQVWVTKLLIAANVIVFVAMLVDGAGIWHSANSVQLAWGANFGPAMPSSNQAHW